MFATIHNIAAQAKGNKIITARIARITTMILTMNSIILIVLLLHSNYTLICIVQKIFEDLF